MNRILQEGRANVIIDGQWGSTGKGKLAGWFCEKERPDVVICDYMPNAGHTYVSENGKKVMVCQLPVGAAFGIPSLLGPHCAINLDILRDEINNYGHAAPISIHPLATIITTRDRDNEQTYAGRVANTAKGGHAASASKALRINTVQLAKDCPALRPYIRDTHQMAQSYLRSGATILVETAQGFDLGLNHGTTYPYVTGRDCLIGRALDNAGLPVRSIGAIIGSLRTYPIRVGNTAVGNSGPYYGDQQELTWDELSAIAGRFIDPERTTVTKRVRRVFTFSYQQIERFCDFVRPTHAFLNFVNYWTEEQRAARLPDLQQFLAERGCHLCLLGTGARNHEMEEITADGE